ncbi:MAG: 7TM-DISM domain-containing protein, partial [Bacteroidota bacterium]
MRRLCLLCLLFIGGMIRAEVGSVIYLTSDHTHLDPLYQMEFWVETQSGVEPDWLARHPQLFCPVERGEIVPDQFEQYIWLRMQVEDLRQESLQSWYFEAWGFDIEEIRFYRPLAGAGYTQEEIGYLHPFGQR